MLKIDLGCGRNKREGFLGVDRLALPGVDHVLDLRVRWPWADDSVDEAHSSHLIEHLEPYERIHFVNELWRVLKPDGKATLIAPHWSSTRSYGDLTHKWPPVCEFWIYYLSADWRAINAPHNDLRWSKEGYSCNFLAVAFPTLHETLAVRNQEYQQFAIQHYKEAWQDIIVNLTKLPAPAETPAPPPPA